MMKKIDTSQLPYLLKLLDDESSTVRETVIKEIKLFGSGIFNEISKLSIDISPVNLQILHDLFNTEQGISLDAKWLDILKTPERFDRLRKICDWIIKYQYGIHCQNNVFQVEQEIFLHFCKKYQEQNAVNLAKYLFKKQGIMGEYYDIHNPELYNLAYVMEKKRGNHYSLLILYLLIARQLDIHVQIIHTNGKIFALIDKRYVIDVFMQGIIKEYDLLEEKQVTFLTIDDLILQLLANLSVSYEHKSKIDERQEILRVHNQYEYLMELTNQQPKQILSSQPFFQIGQIVIHKKYDYRGVIVDMDLCCEVKRLPEKYVVDEKVQKQPWYTILVDKSMQNTYVPQHNLIIDFSTSGINNPLLPHFFSDFENCRYKRNNRTWPSS